MEYNNPDALTLKDADLFQRSVKNNRDSVLLLRSFTGVQADPEFGNAVKAPLC
jgi:hypothetical protein